MATATDVVSLVDMKTHLRYPNPSGANSDDSMITAFIGAAVDVLSWHCDDLLPSLFTETYNGGRCSIWLRHKPLLEVVGVQDNAGYITYDLDFQDVHAVEVNSSGSAGGSSATKIWAFSVDDYETAQITKRTVANVPIPFSPGIRNVSVTYRAGINAPYPPAIVLAVKSLVSHWLQNETLRGAIQSGAYMQYDSTNGSVGVAHHDGSMLMVAGVPNRVIELISAHRRDVVFA